MYWPTAMPTSTGTDIWVPMYKQHHYHAEGCQLPVRADIAQQAQHHTLVVCLAELDVFQHQAEPPAYAAHLLNPGQVAIPTAHAHHGCASLSAEPGLRAASTCTAASPLMALIASP